MFDISSDDIVQLSDVDLRELVARLCEAELVSKGLSAAAVTWGGNQTAADGGLDVRVALPVDAHIDGFVPRPSTGFQVKTPDMPRASILTEMRPGGICRPVIEELAGEAGAYIIVSSKGSTSDSALRNRRSAMREGLLSVVHEDQLQTDFYDRTRLATWVRRHPGLITWVKERIGKAFVGWRPYGPWSGAVDGADVEYLLDDRLRLHLGLHRDGSAQSVADAIDELRDGLAQPGKIVRLVGLSGVGKTRFVEALFDARVGQRALPPPLAVYTNLSDNPDPQPIGLVSDLIANRTRAILIVDNCPPELHRRLCDLCGGPLSTVSVLTVEYDVRDDQPEGTQVVTLDTSSPELIEKLLRRRFPHLSQVDGRTIADASGGNARVAIALANTVERSDTIAGLSNDELFQRLFRQRQEADSALLNAAQACSLVYSFQGEALDGHDAEIPRLASLAGQTSAELYRHVGELVRRDLVQQRGDWRAVLPHAVANRLAALALENTPYDLINGLLLDGENRRLARSFSRRLSFLHDVPKAVAITQRWLKADGLLGDLAALDEIGMAMFENVAPVLPEAALAALERAYGGETSLTALPVERHVALIRSIAYDQSLFERSAELLAQISARCKNVADAKKTADVFVSLFTIFLSGTHASIGQRLSLVKRLLTSFEAAEKALGLTALSKMLEAMHFQSSYRFDFGARSRDYGFQPHGNADVVEWYGAVLALIEDLVETFPALKADLLGLLAQNFRGLWTSANMCNELDRLFRRFASGGFWQEGWAACRQTMSFDHKGLGAETLAQLAILERVLRPKSLEERVRAVVLADRSGGLDLDMDIGGDFMSETERLDSIAFELGVSVATDNAAFSALKPGFFQGVGSRAWAFGRGLAEGSLARFDMWERLVEALEQTAGERNVQILAGFLTQLLELDRDLTQHVLDLAVEQPVTRVFLPVLQSAAGLDERGAERLSRALTTQTVPVWMYRNLAFGGATSHLGGDILRNLLLLLANQEGGFEVALEVLGMRLFSDRSAKKGHEPELLQVCRELLMRVTFHKSNPRVVHELADVAKASLTSPDTAPIAREIAERLGRAMARYETYWSLNDEFLGALFECQPAATLDGLFEDAVEARWADAGIFDQMQSHHRRNPVDTISGEALIAWCKGNSNHRFSLAASIITFACSSGEEGSMKWSEHAKELLAAAPDPTVVLAAFIKRFRPNNWSGSRAALIESNARLLDCLEAYVPSSVIPFVTEAKARLAQDVVREREREAEQDRARDERFE